jgi:2-polyprenyl-6-methoxyphenol hydroxylase-like FAD-dependent oxidoreductase
MNRSRASFEAEGAVIVGGGIAGLATAIALKNVAGVKDITILEASSEQDFQDVNQGSALLLGPNGLKALRAIAGEKLMNQVIDSGTKITGNEIQMPGQTMVLPDTAEQKTGLPNVMIRWGVMRRLLHNHLNEDVKISYDKRVTPEHMKYAPFVDSTSMCIAADGIYSSFAPMVRGDSISNLKDNGRVNIKGVAPMEMRDHCGQTKASFAPDGSVACFAGPAGEGYTYWGISFKDSESGGKTTPFVNGTEDPSFVKEKLLEALASNKAFAFATELVNDTDCDDFFIRRSEESIQIGPSLTKNKVVLVGDAAHAMTASYGQCPNFALEDAATLGWCIRDCRPNCELEDALDDYSNARVDRCAEMADRSSVRFAKATKGQNTEDVWDFIFGWKSPMALADMQAIG